MYCLHSVTRVSLRHWTVYAELIFMGPVFVLQVHARKFCGQFTFLLMFIMLKSLYTFGSEVKEV